MRLSIGGITGHQRLEVNGTEVTWVVFRDGFMENYFIEDLRSIKEIEFLELKQQNLIIVEYAAEFGELVKFCPHYNAATTKGSKCIKFENSLRPEIKQDIG